MKVQTDMIDVKSLHTNIPNKEGIQACYEAWLKQETKDPQHPPAASAGNGIKIKCV